MKKIKKIKVLVAMSGGVDSSVAAKILKDKGYDVTGIFLHFWKEGSDNHFENKCCSNKALMDARIVAKKINIPFYTLNFFKEFKNEVVDYFLKEYECGHTPNPCVVCNKKIKLGKLIEYAKKLGFDYIATGHYARIKREFPISNFQFSKKNEKVNKIKLLKGVDNNKDQSYFLYTLSRDQLKHILFPLGGFTKEKVRQMAKKFKLPVAEKKESQEICFIPEKSHNEFLKRHLKLKKGEIKTLDGKIIGKHNGLPLYTIGQRKGVEIGGVGPFYTAKMDYKKNILYVVNNCNDPILFKNNLIAKNVSWISNSVPKFPLKCEAVIRYRQKGVKCIINSKNSNILVKFNDPQRAITPGQSVVFYKGKEVLGGGIIK